MQNEVFLTLIRHGQSQWNLENRFTGWVDVDLTEVGLSEAERAAKMLKGLNIPYHHCHCSVLKRAIHTLWTIQKNLGLSWLPTSKAWELNERHYGALQGLNKKQTEEKYGADQVKIWRRSYDVPPPLIENDVPLPLLETKELAPFTITPNLNSETEGMAVKNNQSLEQYNLLYEQEKYKMLGLNAIPKGESLKLCQQRVLPYFKSSIAPQLQQGKNLLVVAHGNSLRSLIMEIEGLDGEKIMEVEIETAVPIVYKLKIPPNQKSNSHRGSDKSAIETPTKLAQLHDESLHFEVISKKVLISDNH